MTNILGLDLTGQSDHYPRTGQCDKHSRTGQSDHYPRTGQCDHHLKTGQCDQHPKTRQCDQHLRTGQCDHHHRTGQCDHHHMTRHYYYYCRISCCRSVFLSHYSVIALADTVPFFSRALYFAFPLFFVVLPPLFNLDSC